MDFKDLNRVSPKDDFHLLHINVLVDSVAYSSIYSFMDSFSRYNYIKIGLEDKEHFTIMLFLHGAFYYNVIPFRLKYIKSTYQRVMMTLFHDIMQKQLRCIWMI